MSRSSRQLRDAAERLNQLLKGSAPVSQAHIPSQARRASLRAGVVPPPPWQMSREQFELHAQPALTRTPEAPDPPPPPSRRRGLAPEPTYRYFGLSRALLWRELAFVMHCRGAPEGGYRVRVPNARHDLLDDPRRAFVEAAAQAGLEIPPEVCADFADLLAADEALRPYLA